ncbi:beta-lactamase family protein [Paenibacillus sp. SC116]|uniref:serine hydrolase domain-containing protein n=1 Tax=Paenibacillus sp. SC116 TaxID=2968986 RepID=UPI00215B6C3C|nr:serine hydrolase [Paenibacillus sp. SC116]MCR8844531.1 beta-lactamase family protein [Paenibacillus sp. SC116]
MNMSMNNLLERIEAAQTKLNFSGAVFVKQGDSILAHRSYGYANRSDEIPNKVNTRLGIASGCKIFTAIAIAQLVDQGKLSFDATLKQCLQVSFPYFEDNITVHHLLTHTSGVPDYFDEEEMDDFEQLWITTPMYHVRRLHDFLPLFQHKPMKFPVGSRFHYNNTGFILLGLIVEQASGMSFSDYVQKNIFDKAGMMDSGYFESDRLPGRTALGYIDLPDGGWRTNIYALPAKGGSDGGAYVTVADMARLWEALMNHQLLSKETTDLLLSVHTEAEKDFSYGYGVWLQKNAEGSLHYVLMGYDPGVNFRTVFYPDRALSIVVCSNRSGGAYEMLSTIEDGWN